MSLIDQYGNPLVAAERAAEGQYRDGPWYLPVTGGWLSHEAGSNWNWWQCGYDVTRGGRSAIVEACVSAYSQTIAMCPGDHWRLKDNAGRERVETSALTRILRKPNSYQSISDFMMNSVRSLFLDGNTYALALRNDRFEISQLHLMNPSQSHPIISEDGDVFYRLGGNAVIDRQLNGVDLLVPARDVLHIRMNTSPDRLVGESPLLAAGASIAASGAMTEQQYRFYLNQARPSFVLSTDVPLKREQTLELREMWDKQSQGLGAGGTPILGYGLKPMPIATTSRDSQFADVMKMTELNVALVFRIPPQILGIGSTPFASTEALMQSWKASGLGWACNHIEEAIGLLFGLKGQPDEYLEFNTKALMRSSFKEQIEALTQGTRGGIFAPNEARAEMELPEVEFGSDVRVQQQDVPLSYGANLEPPKPAPKALPAPDEQPQLPKPPPSKGSFDADRLRRGFRHAHAQHCA